MEEKDVVVHNYVAKVYTNVDGVVYRGRCCLIGGLVTADGAAAEIDIYDGLNTNGDQICKIKVADGETRSINLGGKVLCKSGIYVVVNATTTLCTITFHSIDEHETF